MNNRIAGYFDEPWDNVGPVPPPPDERSAGYRAGIAWAKSQGQEGLWALDTELSADESSWEYILHDREYLEEIGERASTLGIAMEDTPILPAERFHFLVACTVGPQPYAWSRALCREFWHEHGPNGSIPDDDFILGFAFACHDIWCLLDRPFFSHRRHPAFHWYAALLRYQDSADTLAAVVDRMDAQMRQDLFDTVVTAYQSAEREVKAHPNWIPNWASVFLKDAIGNALAEGVHKDIRFEGLLIAR